MTDPIQSPAYDPQDICFVVSAYMIEHAKPTGFPLLHEAAVEAGHRVVIMPFDETSPASFDPLLLPREGCVIGHGPQSFARSFNRQNDGQWVPGLHYRTDRLAYSSFASHIGDLLLNDDFVILPFGEVVRRRPRAFGGEIFLKPDGVGKAFAGLTVTEEQFDHEVNSLRRLSRIDDELLCVVARPKPIEAEFRFVVIEGRVVTGSQYRWDDRLDVRLDVLPVCEEVAREVARRSWQPERADGWQVDTAFTCDVALVAGGRAGRVVELNPLATSGLYACDTRAIVAALAASAWREYQGDPLP